MLPLITLEEHYVSQEAESSHFIGFPQELLTKLKSLGDERIEELDKGGVSIQVISHGPFEGSPDMCHKANNELTEAISKNPTRLAGFAVLPMTDPKAAANELSRCVRELGFVGALVDNHLENGSFYDDENFWPVFETAQKLDVPIYLHSTFASDSMLEHYKGNYDDKVATALSAFGWGWHAETGLHILRLYCSGLFDRYPKLKIIIGHMGELLPFQLERIIRASRMWGRERGLREVWQSNIWITTSGTFALAPLACLLQTTTIDHVLYSVDYPFSTNEMGKQFINEIQRSKLMTEGELELFAYLNAEKLLKMKS
ncbi:putative 2-amino-3-carboxymuconate-6-semialdehyde decarboxylase, partial [Stipitochalara longipes BDJ]